MTLAVWLLFFCQALTNLAIIGQAAMSALIGYSLAPDKALATVPYAVQMAAMMSASIPAGAVFTRLGRRPGFLLGAGSALVASLVFAVAVWRADFILYCLGSVPAGLAFGIAQHYRFAAAEVAAPHARPRAIALVMAGGILAAIIGPELVKDTKALAAPLLFLGTYLVLAIPPLVTMLLLSVARLPPPPPRPATPTPLAVIVARPDFLVAVIAGLVAYGSMNLIMTSTPLQMMACGFGVNDAVNVIRWHSIAMYAPGFITGPLIARHGARPVVTAGGVLILLCAATAWAGNGYDVFVVELVLLGVGWNFMFVGATALLSLAHAPEERVRAQAANDFLVFGTVTCTALLSGVLHRYAGWLALNAGVMPGVAVALALVAWQRARSRTARLAFE